METLTGAAQTSPAYHIASIFFIIALTAGLISLAYILNKLFNRQDNQQFESGFVEIQYLIYDALLTGKITLENFLRIESKIISLRSDHSNRDRRNELWNMFCEKFQDVDPYQGKKRILSEENKYKDRISSSIEVLSDRCTEIKKERRKIDEEENSVEYARLSKELNECLAQKRYAMSLLNNPD
jgi:hypothetical protein